VTAAPHGSQHATSATGVQVHWPAFDKAAEDLGASTDEEKASLVGVNRTTLYRWRTGVMRPSLGRALDLAHRLRLDLDQLFERV
jgi:DNA-binding XRE family transcriptional regulator